MESETPGLAPDSEPTPKEKALYTDMMEAFAEAHKKHPDVNLADAILLAGSLLGSVIGASFNQYGVLKVGFVRNVEKAMHRAVFKRQPVAGNA